MSHKFELSLFADVGRTGIIFITGKVFATNAGGNFSSSRKLPQNNSKIIIQKI